MELEKISNRSIFTHYNEPRLSIFMKNIFVNKLKQHNLRSTPCREQVIKIFMNRAHALSHADLERALSDHFDRVTIYRTLNTFLHKGLIHKVTDNEGVIRYAICNHEQEGVQHNDNHVHFKCQTCGNIQCLEETVIPQIKLPPSYQIKEVTLLVEGICQDCLPAKKSSR